MCTSRLGCLLPLACLAGVAAAQAAVASTQTLVFDGVYAHYKFVDKGPKGDSPGDTQKASGVLHDDSGKTVGTFEFTCVWAKVVKDDVLENCSISITTADGTLNGSGTGHRYSPNPPWRLTGGSGAYAGATGSVLTRDIAGRDEAVTDSVGVVTVTAKHRLKAGVVPRPPANRPFVTRADAVCSSSQAKLSALPPFPVSNFDPWHPDPKALPAVGHFFAEPARRALEEQLQHDLVGLGEPPADLADWARFLRDRARTLAVGQAQIRAALDADVAGFVRTVEEDDALNRKITIDAGIVGAESCTFF